MKFLQMLLHWALTNDLLQDLQINENVTQCLVQRQSEEFHLFIYLPICTSVPLFRACFRLSGSGDMATNESVPGNAKLNFSAVSCDVKIYYQGEGKRVTTSCTFSFFNNKLNMVFNSHLTAWLFATILIAQIGITCSTFCYYYL